MFVMHGPVVLKSSYLQIKKSERWSTILSGLVNIRLIGEKIKVINISLVNWRSDVIIICNISSVHAGFAKCGCLRVHKS